MEQRDAGQRDALEYPYSVRVTAVKALRSQGNRVIIMDQ